MSTLVKKSGPNERFYINGALARNGSRRTQICLPNADTESLRARDTIEAPVAIDRQGAACGPAQSVLMIRKGRAEILGQLKAQMRALRLRAVNSVAAATIAKDATDSTCSRTGNINS